MYWTESLGRFDLTITLADAELCSHPGPCDADVADLRIKPAIRRQLAKIDPETLKEALHEYGAWEADELTDHETNLNRILWLACCDISEAAYESKRSRK